MAKPKKSEKKDFDTTADTPVFPHDDDLDPKKDAFARKEEDVSGFWAVEDTPPARPGYSSRLIELADTQWEALEKVARTEDRTVDAFIYRVVAKYLERTP